MNPLQAGKKRWHKWLEFNGDQTSEAPYLEAVSRVIHGRSWPNEWIQFIIEMWSDPRCTRKGEGVGDYCYDPKIRKGRPPEPHVIHYLEMPRYAVQEIMQTEGELRFSLNFTYADGKIRTFPRR